MALSTASLQNFIFRTRKDASQTFDINARDWKVTSKQGKLFACMKTSKEGIPKTASCAVRVSMEKLGRVFLIFMKRCHVRGRCKLPLAAFIPLRRLTREFGYFKLFIMPMESESSGVKEI